ncbi:MAG: DUF2459 domain-containing protein [Candidatus Rokubacteria bacterium]|nr:DUF2459 domain-containing protein [Candidatus Rokubacteria bacterium]
MIRPVAAWAVLGPVLALAAGCLGPVASLYPPRPGEAAVPVWLVDHGWHVGLVVPRAAIPSGLLPEQEDFPGARYLEVGWGDADFYRTPEAGVGLAVKAALASGGSAVHMVGLRAPPTEIFPGREIVEIRLSEPGFVALVRFVDGSLAREGSDRAPALGPGLYGTSAFYPARGRYRLWNTCNTWVAEALRAAGAPITPAWAMSAGYLMHQARQVGHPAGAP